MILESKHLLLVTSHPDLAGPLTEYYIRNRVFLKAFDPVRMEAFFRQERQKEILMNELDSEQKRQSYRFYIKERENPEQIIGFAGLGQIIWGSFESCFLGYKLDESRVNRGYMTEAVSAVVEWGFTKAMLHRIEANVMPRNLPSLRVLEKCGFENEGLSRKYLKINGVWEDHVHMVKLNEK